MITPDTKDWTWVLRRPCPECGFDAARADHALVGSMVRENAAAWVEVLARPGVAHRPTPAVWSPLEYACHVRDVFRRFDERLVLMLTEDDPGFANWDQDATAVAERYAEQNPAVVSAELMEAGSIIAARFDGVSGAQ